MGEALAAAYPRLAQLLEDMLAKLLRDTNVSSVLDRAESRMSLPEPNTMAICIGIGN